MEIKGNLGFLTKDEEIATGLKSPVFLDQIIPFDLLAKIYERSQGIEAMRYADDELTHSERASIIPLTEKLRRDSEIIRRLAEQLTAHQAEVFLQKN